MNRSWPVFVFLGIVLLETCGIMRHMDQKEKTVKILLLVALLMGMSAISITMAGEQRAAVGSFFGPDNINKTVLEAQTKLEELGLYEGRLSGLFGVKTRAAVLRFQEQKGLVQNGILDMPTQRALFYVVPEPVYLPVSYTKEGNSYLEKWIRFYYSEISEPVEMKGELVLGDEDAVYLEGAEPTRLVLVTEKSRYSIYNISSNDLSAFVGAHVMINGYLLGHENNLGLDTIVVNYVYPGESNPSAFVDYTREGNNYLNKWVRKTYQEEGQPIVISGMLNSSKTKVVYGPNGYPTQLALTVGGTRYSLENISPNSLKAFVGQNVTVRGVVLKRANELGLKTIVINYVSENPTKLPVDPAMNATAQ